MSLATGTRFGPYEIISPLGAGGMGEVYRARDTRLGREVAVKVLPSSFSDDEQRLHRFEQEACATGALNHPNILAIHDVGKHDGSSYVVSEPLEGETLRERMAGTALPQRKAIEYSLQIARGLAAAHEKGIVHRDLKPDNIFITKDGRVKILDFGLAKLTEPAVGQSKTDLPTRRIDTDPGMVLGTVGYMSPEQVRGRPVDHRADIFSFGAILYEMLTGKRAFHGESAAETMSAILREDPPDLSESNKNVSPALERVVGHCLEKNPEERFHSARDLAFAIEALSGSTPTSTQTAATPTLGPRWIKRRELIAWIAAAIFLLALLAVLPIVIVHLRRAPSETTAAATRFLIYPPEKATFSGPFTVSPDGRRVALRCTSEGKTLLWVRALNSLTAQPLAGTEDATLPFWSPDSRFIGFFSGGKLKKIEATGGPAQPLCDAPQGSSGGAWNAEGVIIFHPRFSDALYRVSAAGGAPAPLTTLDASRKEVAHVYPQFLPDGRRFIYLAISAQRENSGIFVGSLDSKETKLLVNAYQAAAYARPGYLLFMRERTLMAQSFDADRLELRGEPFPVAEQVDLPMTSEPRYAYFSVSETGVLVYRRGSSRNFQLTWFDRSGKQLGTVGPPGDYVNHS
ncbi:MAG TPA: protein kinase, partial [Blastocatellia bacterium]|nr:protein kinase [Blastocatellia bacterium]